MAPNLWSSRMLSRSLHWKIDPDFVAAEPIETALADDLEEGVEAFKPGRMTRHYVIYLIT